MAPMELEIQWVRKADGQREPVSDATGDRRLRRVLEA